jgi:alpha-L-rhamnosidase
VLPLDAQSLTVFQVQCKIQLQSGSNRASLLFGGNDARLLDANQNTAGIQAVRDSSYFRAELDCSQLSQGAQIHFYRSGYTKTDDPSKPIGSVTVPKTLINESNCYQPHVLNISSMYGILAASVDGQELAMPNVDWWSKGINGNPYGMSGGSTAYPVVGDIGYAVAPGQTARFSQLKVKNFRQPQADLFRLAEDVLLDGGTMGHQQLLDPSHDAMPMLRTTFRAAGKKIRRARLYAAARGIYTLSVNGQSVSKDYFAPGFTQYNQSQLYQAYDVTNMLRAGRENVLGAQLGEGWWSGAITFMGTNWNYFGDRQSLLTKLVVTYEDGTTEVIASKPETWQYYADGPVRLGSFLQGESYDGLRAAKLDGWDRPGYDAVKAGWKAAARIDLKETTAPGKWHEVLTDRTYEQKFDAIDLTAQSGSEVRPAALLTAQSVKEVRPGVFLYDMGQNFAGVPRINVRNGKAGQKVTLRFAEVTYPDGPNAGMIMLENLRAAMVRDTFILKGGPETLQPQFTYHGYRYIEITGLDQALPLKAVQGQVLTSIPELAAEYKTSNPDVNRLFQNIQWSAQANFLAIPTDCPQRNERMGWSGDLDVFAPTAVYLADSDAFLRQHLMSLRDLQGGDGRFTDTAPMGQGGGGFLWGSVGVQVPWELYLQYGDTAVLAEHYAAMKRYVDYMTACEQPDGLLKEKSGLPGLGDWLGPENNRNEPQYLWNVYQVRNLEILSRTAAVLGKTAESMHYAALRTKRQQWFTQRFWDPAVGKAKNSAGGWMDTQTAYAVPLALDVLTGAVKEQAGRRLLATVQRENTDDQGAKRPAYSLMTGFIGTSAISHALSLSGSTEAAYRLLQNDQYPSWLYPVKNGATTIWERLDSYTKERGFGGNNSMNSFNHYSFGAVGAWMMDTSLGIRRDEAQPGFHHFYLEPQPDPSGKMSEAAGHYDSIYGRIESSWQKRKDGNGWQYRFVIPANTTATLRLPHTGKRVLCNGREQAYQASVKLVSGSYTFDVIN